MAIYTTNWYLYKTHFHSISPNSQIGNSRTENQVYGFKKRKRNFNTRNWGHQLTMSFEELLLAAMDEEFSSLGEECKQAIYFLLEKEFKLNKQNIPSRIEDFSEAIESIFGIGAQVLEIRIMKNLFKKIGRPFPYLHNQKFLDCTNYIESARNAFAFPFAQATPPCTRISRA